MNSFAGKSNLSGFSCSQTAFSPKHRILECSPSKRPCEIIDQMKCLWQVQMEGKQMQWQKMTGEALLPTTDEPLVVGTLFGGHVNSSSAPDMKPKPLICHSSSFLRSFCVCTFPHQPLNNPGRQ